MKICNHCGAQLPDNASVCFRCKASLTGAANPQQAQVNPQQAQVNPQQAQVNPQQAPAGQNPYGKPPVRPQAPAGQNAYARPPMGQQAPAGQNPYMQQPASQQPVNQPGAYAQPVSPANFGDAQMPPEKKGLSKGALIGIIAGAVAVVAIIVVVFVLLGGKKKQENMPAKGPSQQTTQAADTDYSALPNKLTAKKIGTAKKNINVGKGGIYYEDESGKFGIMSFDGKSDTGAKYAKCEDEGSYFVVSATSNMDENDLSTINVKGLTDVSGKELIPQKYAFIKVLDERYAEVLTASALTDSKDDCIFYLHEGYVSFSPSDDDIMFKGTWELFDIKAGDFVPGVSGTIATNITTYGSFVRYHGDDGEYHFVDSKGQPVSDSWEVLSDGSYYVKDGTTATMYDPQGNKLFSFNPDTDYNPQAPESDYYVARKSTEGSTTYACIDQKGKIISKEFEESFTASGKLILLEGCVYNFKGEKLIDGDYSTLRQDETFTSVYYLSSSNHEKVIDENGKVILSDDDGAELEASYYVAYKEANEERTYYCVNKQAFTISGSYATAEWLIEQKAGGDDYSNYNLVDTLSGNAIIKGYVSFAAQRDANGLLYVYAKNANSGTYDIYTVE
ncbi:MAG: hypothetical protein IJJ41_06520 [Clostridia bacterium]|nr:hypothetical protein [Clostridia bacterium]